MKYKANIIVELSVFLESIECTNCISAQDMKFLILLPPFFLLEKYIARQEEIPASLRAFYHHNDISVQWVCEAVATRW